MNVCIISGNYQYKELFQHLGHKLVEHVEHADLVVFTGGEDVTPSYYGDTKHQFTGNNESRDASEAKIFNYCKDNGIPMVGICRGGQFLNVMSGGRMYQHVGEHTRSHYITDAVTGETVYVSSTHHQMMMPSSEAVLVASSNLAGDREWFDGQVFKRDVSNQDIEVLYYPSSKALCFQPHPEFTGTEYDGMYHYFASLLKRYLNVA